VCVCDWYNVVQCSTPRCSSLMHSRIGISAFTGLRNIITDITWHVGWRRGVVVSGVRQWTKLTHVGPGYNWDRWPSSGGYTISGCNQPTRSTQPCIPPGSLKSSTSFGWGKGGNITSAGWQVTLCDPVWHASSRSGVATLRTAIHLLAVCRGGVHGD